MGKFPGIFIFHRPRCSITEYSVDFLGRMFPHYSAGNDHQYWNEQVANKHKPPKPHRTYPPCLCDKIGRAIFSEDIAFDFIINVRKEKAKKIMLNITIKKIIRLSDKIL